MSSKFVSVTVLTGYIKNIIASEDLLQNISLAGEVSGIRCSGAHAYFTLKDENAQIECCCFGYAKGYLPKSGESVILTGSLDFYQKGGKMTFIAKSIQPLGQGALAVKLEQLKQKLIKAGYFKESHKKAIPKYPSKVCVITARTGAVIRDIVSTIRKKNEIIDIDVYDVKVQGITAVGSMINALKTIDTMGYDVIIIARGGGSLEDLMPFNDESLVYQIFDTNTPVISAVGHETDFTLCDFVSDVRVPTPTAAGELVGYDVEEIKRRVIGLMEMCDRRVKTKLHYAGNSLVQSVRRLVSCNNLVISNNKNKIDMFASNMTNVINNKFTAYEHVIAKLNASLDANNPTKILSRGYSKLYDSIGHSIDANGVSIGDDIIVLADGGRIGAVVSSVKLNDKGNESNGKV